MFIIEKDQKISIIMIRHFFYAQCKNLSKKKKK